MKYSNVFTDVSFPKTLTLEEFNYYYNLFKEGNMDARNKLIESNMKLVILVIQSKFGNDEYEFDELFSVGIVGLIKAIDTFDGSKNKMISTYAYKCIENEILMYFRKNKRNNGLINLEMPYSRDSDNPITIGEMIVDDNIDLEETAFRIDFRRKILKLMKSILTDKELRAVLLYYGFINGKKYLQDEIALMLKINRPTVSKIIARALKKIKRTILFNSEWLEMVQYYGFSNDEIYNGYSRKMTSN